LKQENLGQTGSSIEVNILFSTLTDVFDPTWSYAMIKDVKEPNDKPRKKLLSDDKLFVIEVLLFVLLYVLSMTVFSETYLFSWVIHRWYRFILFSVPPLFFALLNKNIISISLLSGTFLGLFMGNYLDDVIVMLNKSKIAAESKNLTHEEIYRYYHHPGFEMWVGIILASFILGLILQAIYKSNLKNV
jgi:hypothetical protein